MNTYDFISGVGDAAEDEPMFLGIGDTASTPAVQGSSLSSGDALSTATQALLTALVAAPGYPAATPCSSTASAASAFQSAYNTTPAIPNTVAPTTGTYDAGTQVALQAAINSYQALSPPVSFTSGSAPPPCGSGGGHRAKKPPVDSTVTPPTLPVDQTTSTTSISAPSPVAPPVDTSPPLDFSSVVSTPVSFVQPPTPPPPPVDQTFLPPPPPAPPMFVQPPAPPTQPMEFEPQPYIVQPGDSPEIIVRRLGVPFRDLLRANPHRPTVHVGGGVHTWRDRLVHGERLRVPARRGRGRLGGALGDALSPAQALAAVNPCDQANVDLVCAFQRSVKQPADGKYGTDTAHALVAQIPTAPAGCHPRPMWWSAHGRSNCGTAAASIEFPADVIVGHRPQRTEVAGPLPQMPYRVTPGDSPTLIAQKLGVPFAALLGANPHKPITVVAGVPTWVSLVTDEVLNIPMVPGMVGDPTPGDALVLRAGGMNAPDTQAAAQSLLSAQSTVSASHSLAIAAAQTLAAVNPCDQASAGLVSAFQQSAGISPDGKYGSDTAKALATLVPGAPAGCHPRPAWWDQGKGNSPMTARYVPPPPMRQVPPPPPVAAPAHPYVPAPMAFRPPHPRYPQGTYSPAYVPGLYTPEAYGSMPGLPDVPAPPPAADAPAAPPAAALAPVAPPVAAPPPVAPDSPPPASHEEHEKKGISTEMLIAGGVGAVALVGIVAAVAMSGGKSKQSTVPARASEATRRTRGVNRTVWSGNGADGCSYHIMQKPSGYSVFRTDVDNDDESFVGSFKTIRAAKKAIGAKS
jgi:LysM repeat protein